MNGIGKPRSKVSRETSARSVPSPARAAPNAPEVQWTTAQWTPVVLAELALQGIGATESQVGALAAYMAMLQRWNATYNLTALRSPGEMRTHHLADCLAVVPPLASWLAGAATRAAQPPQPSVLDVGSGGGLPGVVLAILMPGVRVTCVDTVGKKAAFIRQAAAELSLPNLKSEHQRVEKLVGQFTVVTSRAFASLADFTTWTAHLMAPGSVWMAMKGKAPEPDEWARLPSVQCQRVESLQVPGLDAERCLVWMTSAAVPA